MAKLEIKDSAFSCEINSDNELSSLDSRVRSVLHFLNTLNELVAMSSYDIARVGATDVWNVTAESQDARTYSATTTYADDTFVNTATTFPEGTIGELRAFLDLLNVFALILKACEVSSVEIAWT